ncbi:Outer membrane protein TolC [Chitinophaga jiangningensis]|uniref:Outer membrane protein TolC n=1 Tax=Chitinophaga jiangningensis TaxID=1419482 RepID=A0A1M7ANK4_9BACT|nr:TolC family protein [Chitinophaga jiangningensis]SHL44321.1 Outer membrane protein TolC [Chitinophaga jiangningensis]
MTHKLTALKLVLLLTFPAVMAAAQEPVLTLEQCHTLAEQHYPLIKRYDLINASRNYSLANAGKIYLPQLNISGSATYQSDVVSFPQLPPAVGITFPTLSKDQYKVAAEVQQTIFDANNSHYQKEVIKASSDVEKQSVTVNLYAIRERVDQLYFSILLMDEQLKQNNLRLSDLDNAIEKVSAAYRNGTAYRSNVDELKAERSSAKSQEITFKSNRSAYTQMLGAFIGRQLPDTVPLQMPEEQPVAGNINRPELAWYQYRRKAAEVQEQQLKSEYLPRFNAFFQGAYGRPTLNFLENDFGAWYITGLRLNWNFGSLYSLKNNRRIIENNRKSISVEEETFLFNTNMNLTQQRTEVKKFHEMIAEDEAAIGFRASVKQSAKAQLENGVITVHDYIGQLNAENQARQLLILHKLQLLQATYQYKFIAGN